MPTWQLVLLLIAGGFLAATLLRLDHLEMVRLKTEVLTADEKGDDMEIAEKLKNLKQFVFSHTVVNVIEKNGVSEIILGTGPFYLEKQYQRKASEEIRKIEEQIQGGDHNPNGNVFAKAMGICKPLAIRNGWAWNSPSYLNCMTGEINKYPAEEQLKNTFIAKVPPTSLYRHNYASPLITKSGGSLVILACLGLVLVIMIRIIIGVGLRIALFFLKRA